MSYALSAGSCEQCTKRGREELPHVQGQGQKLGGPHARRVAAKRSYPTSEVKCSGLECQAVMAQERIRDQGWQQVGATPHPRSGGCMAAGGPRGAIPC